METVPLHVKAQKGCFVTGRPKAQCAGGKGSIVKQHARKNRRDSQEARAIPRKAEVL